MRVVIAEDSVLLREGLIRLLTEQGTTVTAAVGDGEQLLRATQAHQPDVCLIDVRMPPTFVDEGLRAALVIRHRWPHIGVLVLSQYVEERYASELIGQSTHGVGYLLKDRVADVAEFADALRRVAAGGAVLDPEVVQQLVTRSHRTDPLAGLSTRERDVLTAMAQGRSNAGISHQLFIGAGAVEKHISSISRNSGWPPKTANTAASSPSCATWESDMTTAANDTSSPTDRHPRPGRPLMLAAGLLLAVLVGAVVWVLVTLALPGRRDFSYRADLPPATQLRIDTASAAFTLAPSPDSGIHISAHGSYTDIEPTIHTATGGDTATITSTCAHPGLFRRCDLQVQLLLPTELPVTADVGNGQLTARDLSGPLNLTTGNGIIQAVTTTGTLSLHTSNGTIRLTDSRSAHVTADTTNGAMNLAFAVPPVTLAAHSTNGALDITVPGTNAYFITATTTNGSKHIDLPTDRSAPDSITATTTNGAIHITPTSP